MKNAETAYSRGSIRARILEYVTKNPRIKAKKVETALRLAENSGAAHMGQMVKDGWLSRQQNENGYYEYAPTGYFGEKKKEEEKKKEPTNKGLKGIKIPTKDALEFKQKAQELLGTAPGLTTSEIMSLTGSTRTTTYVRLNGMETDGLLRWALNDEGITIWFLADHEAPFVPANDEMRKKVGLRPLENEDDEDDEDDEEEGDEDKEEKEEEEEEEEDEGEEEPSVVESSRTSLEEFSKEVSDIDAEEERLTEEIEEIEAKIEEDTQYLNGLKKQLEYLQRVETKRQRLNKLKEQQKTLAAAIDEISKQLIQVKESIMRN